MLSNILNIQITDTNYHKNKIFNKLLCVNEELIHLSLITNQKECIG